MAAFSDLVADLDDCVEEELCDPGLFLGVEPPLPVRMILLHPNQAERLQSVSFTRALPVLKVRRAVLPDLKEQAVFELNGDRWAVAAAPTADDDGAWWLCQVEPA